MACVIKVTVLANSFNLRSYRNRYHDVSIKIIGIIGIIGIIKIYLGNQKALYVI